MDRLLPAPFAELLQLDFPLDSLLVLMRIIIPPFADGAAEGDETVGTLDFSHVGDDNTFLRRMQPSRHGVPVFKDERDLGTSPSTSSGLK